MCALIHILILSLECVDRAGKQQVKVAVEGTVAASVIGTGASDWYRRKPMVWWFLFHSIVSSEYGREMKKGVSCSASWKEQDIRELVVVHEFLHNINVVVVEFTSVRDKLDVVATNQISFP
jgi:hypothetical protein